MKWKILNFAMEPIPPGALEKPKANTISAGSSGDQWVGLQMTTPSGEVATARIFNNKSNLLSTVTRSGNTFNVPLTNLPDGTYIIEVSSGKTSYRQQLIVKHK